MECVTRRRQYAERAHQGDCADAVRVALRLWIEPWCAWVALLLDLRAHVPVGSDRGEHTRGYVDAVITQTQERVSRPLRDRSERAVVEVT